MGLHRRGVLVALALVAGSAQADQGVPVYTAIPTLPSAGGACSGSRNQIEYLTGKIWCCSSGTWAACGSAAGSSPGGSSGNLQTNNGAGGFGAYAGSTCGAGTAPLGLTASGIVTGCFTPPGTYSLPDAAAGTKGGIQLSGQLGGTAASPTVTGVTGAVVGLGNLTATGSPGVTTFLRGDNTWGVPIGQVTGGAGDIQVNGGTGTFSAYGGTSCSSKFVRALSGQGSATCNGVALADLTATGTPSISTFLRGDNTWSAAPAWAPTGATYITQTADAGLSGEQALSSLASGFVKVTTTTGVLSSVATVDLSTDTAATVLPMTKGGTGANLTGTVGALLSPTSTTVTGQIADVAVGAALTSGGVGAAPVYSATGTCTSSAATTCTIASQRSGCKPVCSMTTSASTTFRAAISTTTITCTFGTSGTNTCNCICF